MGAQDLPTRRVGPRSGGSRYSRCGIQDEPSRFHRTWPRRSPHGVDHVPDVVVWQHRMIVEVFHEDGDDLFQVPALRWGRTDTVHSLQARDATSADHTSTHSFCYLTSGWAGTLMFGSPFDRRLTFHATASSTWDRPLSSTSWCSIRRTACRSICCAIDDTRQSIGASRTLRKHLSTVARVWKQLKRDASRWRSGSLSTAGRAISLLDR